MPSMRGREDLGVVRHLLRGGVGEVGEEREVDHRIEVRERLHLEVLEEPARTAPTLGSSAGTITIVRPSSGHAALQVEARQPPGRREAGPRAPASSEIATSLAGISATGPTHACREPPSREPRPRAATSADRQDRDRPEVEAGGVPEDEALHALAELRARTRRRSRASRRPLADQVVARRARRADPPGFCSAAWRALSMHRSATPRCASAVGSASSSIAWR